MADHSEQVNAILYKLPAMPTYPNAIAWRWFGEEGSGLELDDNSSAEDIYYQKTFCRWVFSEANNQLYYTHAFSETIWDSFRGMYLDFCDHICRIPRDTVGEEMH